MKLIRRIVNVPFKPQDRFFTLSFLFLQSIEAAAILNLSARQLLRRRPTEVAAIAMQQPISVGV